MYPNCVHIKYSLHGSPVGVNFLDCILQSCIAPEDYKELELVLQDLLPYFSKMNLEEMQWASPMKIVCGEDETMQTSLSLACTSPCLDKVKKLAFFFFFFQFFLTGKGV